MAEYKTKLQVASAITNVNDRFKREEEEKQRLAEMQEQKEQEQKIKQEIAESEKPVETPKEETQEKLYSMTFKVYGTLEQLKKIKAFLETMKKEGVKYE